MNSLSTLRQHHRLQLIRAVYNTLLDRDPDPEGYHHHRSTLLSAASVASVVKDITNSEEFRLKHRAFTLASSGTGSAKASLNANARATSDLTTHLDRICVVKLDHIGDLLLATPVFRALKNRYPYSYITAVVSPESAPLLHGNPFISEVVEYSAPWFWRQPPSGARLLETLASNARTLRHLLQSEYDLVVNLRADLANLLLSSSIPHKRLLSFVNHTIYPYLVSEPVDCPFVLHAYEQHKYLLREGLGIDVLGQPELFPSQRDKSKAAELLPRDKPIIALAPGAGIALKQWPLEKFALLAQRLTAKGINIVVVGSQADYEKGASICESCGAQNLCGKLTLLEVAAVLSHCPVLVTNDSAPAHIAAATDTIVVCIMRPNVVSEFRPVGDHHIILSARECLSPCTGFDAASRNSLRTSCRCINEIDVDEVEQNTLRTLDKATKLRARRERQTLEHANSDNHLLIVRGDLRSYSGYAYATRCYTRKWLEQFDVVYGVDISYHPSRSADVWPHPLIEDADIPSLSTHYQHITVITISSPDNFVRFKEAYNIGLFFYETDRFDGLTWGPKLALMDEIRVPAPFLRSPTRASSPESEVLVEPVPLDVSSSIVSKQLPIVRFDRVQRLVKDTTQTSRSDFQTLQSSYSHIFFSSCTVIPRKGLPILAHEWLSFASRHPRCTLLLKVSSIDITHTKENVLAQIRSLFESAACAFPDCTWNVYCTSDALSEEDILALQTQSAAFVTCSFGEGFGLGIFESLSLGTPIVCPRHTAFADFLPADYPYFLTTDISNYGLADPAGVYPISARWGVPLEGTLTTVLNALISDIETGKVTANVKLARDFFVQALSMFDETQRSLLFKRRNITS